MKMDDLLMLEDFAARRCVANAATWPGCAAGAGAELIEPSHVVEFVKRSGEILAGHGEGDVLRRAILFTFPTAGESLDISFISLYAALEATLTFFRHQGRYKILSHEEFAALERDLKRWLKQHMLLTGRSEERALIYEKIRDPRLEVPPILG
jgi:hypothetical protein